MIREEPEVLAARKIINSIQEELELHREHAGNGGGEEVITEDSEVKPPDKAKILEQLNESQRQVYVDGLPEIDLGEAGVKAEDAEIEAAAVELEKDVFAQKLKDKEDILRREGARDQVFAFMSRFLRGSASDECKVAVLQQAKVAEAQRKFEKLQLPIPFEDFPDKASGAEEIKAFVEKLMPLLSEQTSAAEHRATDPREWILFLGNGCVLGRIFNKWLPSNFAVPCSMADIELWLSWLVEVFGDPPSGSRGVRKTGYPEGEEMDVTEVIFTEMERVEARRTGLVAYLSEPPSWENILDNRSKGAPGEAVNHPKHYNMGKIEVIDAIEEWRLGFNLGNAVKYIARAGHKKAAEVLLDLKKAHWYLERGIAGVKKGLAQFGPGESEK